MAQLSIGALDLGTVTLREKITIDNRIWKKGLPGTSSDKGIAMDVFGKERRISFKGVKTGSTADLKTWAEGIDAWANSNLQERKKLTSSIGIEYMVKCDVFEYEILVNRAEYRMEVVETGL
jgi:hypothetical protein